MEKTIAEKEALLRSIGGLFRDKYKGKVIQIDSSGSTPRLYTIPASEVIRQK
jgi:hypothetical protein